jgi:hypothetical protein
LLDLAKDTLERGPSLGVDHLALFGRNHSDQGLLGGQILWGTPSDYRRDFCVLWFSCGNLGFEQDILKDHDAPFRKVTCIGAHSQSGRNSSKMLLDHIQDRFDFTDVIGFLKKMGGHDHLICIIHQGLARPSHYSTDRRTWCCSPS